MGFQKIKNKTANELVQKLRAPLLNLLNRQGYDSAAATSEQKELERLHDEALKYFEYVKITLYGDEANPVNAEKAAEVIHLCVTLNMLYLFVAALPYMLPDERLYTLQIFKVVARQQALKNYGKSSTVEAGVEETVATQEFSEQPEANASGQPPTNRSKELLISLLYQGYDSQDYAIISGSILHQVLRDEECNKIFLESPNFADLFNRVNDPHFEISQDAFATFKMALTLNVEMAEEYLVQHYDEFFEKYHNALKADNFVTRKNFLKFLGELLWQQNTYIMQRYVSDVKHLMLIMQLLKDRSKSIQFEAFHVFKTFVATPEARMSPEVREVLSRNKAKLLAYLEPFQSDRQDMQLEDDKRTVLSKIESLANPSDEAVNTATFSPQPEADAADGEQ